ncbi:RNA methyltransferase, TrmH family [Andreprevotia lacus DSM 23236]|jgi:TrmH family RNA methyltransferase|uniref:RNA methyltransferase, TrmH family n=1 Tax=Andreprevotia lacus DSM 23236 TaxID=1121001 RepID=A0A1W1XLE5_9NEIS|nr:RNA methyltransferase [Andreprevotia lacus]SMC24799.1 RNA methyltransferase, TrmH family [Andreprevotia lacus DSM 23236]
MELIQSTQNPLYKLAGKLATHRRDRLKQGLMLLDGTHLVAAALDAGLALQHVLVTQAAINNPECVALVKRADARVHLLDEPLFATLSELPSLTGMLAIAAMPAPATPQRGGLVLALDGVQDPGNVGSILRTALAAGVGQVWLSPGCADVWSPKVLRAGMGAQFVLALHERANLPALLAAFDGPVAATLLEGSVDLYDADLRGNLALVLGAEGQGVSPDIAALATLRLRIPMAPGIESLNVGAAAAICLYERVRQSR